MPTDLTIRMEKEMWRSKLEDDFVAFAAEYPQSALSLVTGLFVGLLEHAVGSQGGDKSQEIKIDGNGKRDITVHAWPTNPAKT